MNIANTFVKKLSIAVAGATIIVLNTGKLAQAITLTFDELPFQPVDNLSFMGVTFDFKIGGVDSTDANYNSSGPGNITFVQDPSLEGNAAGILTLDFDKHIAKLEFDVSLNTFNPLVPGFTVELFDKNLTSLGVTPINTNPLISFTENTFSFVGISSVKRAIIDFNETTLVTRFALDNLHFEEEQKIPEPTSFSGLLLVLIAASKELRRKISSRNY